MMTFRGTSLARVAILTQSANTVYITARKLQGEKMDEPDVDPAELARALRHLARTNRLLGGTRCVMRLFQQWSREWPGTDSQPIRVLDVGTGSADFPIALSDWAQRAGFNVHITAIDLHPLTLDYAKQQVGERGGIELLQMNALELTDHFQPKTFDYAHAGLFLHHLQDIEVLTVLRMMDRLARHAVVWNDLIRSWLTKKAIWPLAITGPPIFRHDAIASMNAGFSKREAIDIARRVGLENVRYRNHWLHRFVLTSEKE